MHHQVNEVKQKIICSEFEINQITEAPPNQARNVGGDCPEQNHLGVVGIVLEFPPQEILVGKNQPETNPDDYWNHHPVILLFAHRTPIVSYFHIEGENHFIVAVVGKETTVAIFEHKIVVLLFFYCELH